MSWLGDAVDSVADAGASMLGIDGPSQNNANQQQYDQANRRGNQQRGQYNNQARQLESQAGGAFPVAVPLGRSGDPRQARRTDRNRSLGPAVSGTVLG